jgi:long-chain acyl-CoA synthetase
MTNPALEPDDHDSGWPHEHLLLSAGRPYPWVEVKIVDTLTQKELPAGQLGEIWTRSEQNLVGYFNRPEETAAALTPTVGSARAISAT